MAGRITDVEGDPKNPKIVLRHRRDRRHLEDDQRRHDVHPALGSRADRVDGRHRDRAERSEDHSTPARARTTRATASRRAAACTSRSTAASPGSRSDSRRRSTSAASSSIRRIRTSSTSPRVGATWASNPERGLYKTIDGGKTWQHDQVHQRQGGLHRRRDGSARSEHAVRGIWERVRGPYFLKSGGPGSALWKTTDAGKTLARDQGRRIPRDRQGPHEHPDRARAIRTSCT